MRGREYGMDFFQGAKIVVASVFLSLVGLTFGNNDVSGAGVNDLVKVKGHGVGEDKTLALKDAFRDAVERAVGMYVDAEQQVANDALIKDKILVHSNAYIQDFSVSSEEKKRDGNVDVVIIATVKKQELTKTLRDAMPVKKFSLGEELKRQHQVLVLEKQKKEEAARRKAEEERLEALRKEQEQLKAAQSEESKRMRDRKAAQLLSGSLEGFNPFVTLIDIDRDGSVQPKVLGGDDDTQVCFSFCMRINADRYFKTAVPRLKQVLGQISLREPETIAYILEPVKDGGIRNSTVSFEGATASAVMAEGYEAPTMEYNGHPTTLKVISINEDDFGSQGSMVWVVESLVKGENGRMRVKMVGYSLADTCVDAWNQMVQQWCAVKMNFRAELLDSDEKTVTGLSFALKSNPLFCGWGVSLEDKEDRSYYLTPFFFMPQLSTLNKIMPAEGQSLPDEDEQRICNLVRNLKVDEESARKAYIHALNQGFRNFPAYVTAMKELQSNGTMQNGSPKNQKAKDDDVECTESDTCVFNVPLTCVFKVLSEELTKISTVRVRVLEGK